MAIANNATVSDPLYLRGSLCIGNNALVTAPIRIGGTLTLNNNAAVGTDAAPVSSVDVVGGCTNGHDALHACVAADGIHAQHIGASVPTITKPAVDLAGWYQNSAPGPGHPCTSGSFPGGFDNDALLNTSRATVDLTPAAAYDCRVTDGGGHTIGRISWTPGNPGTLVIAGTIFFDGNILMQNNVNAVYQGQATIYSSGTITLNNSVRLCGVAACDATWNPASNVLVFVAGAGSGNGFTISNNGTFQGGAYVVSDYYISNNSTNWGPVVAHQLGINNNAGQVIPIDTLPVGAPVNSTSTVSLRIVAGSWTG
jgi:hypothetical protein